MSARATALPPRPDGPRVLEGDARLALDDLLQDRPDGEQDVPRLEAGDGPGDAELLGDEVVGLEADDRR